MDGITFDVFQELMREPGVPELPDLRRLLLNRPWWHEYAACRGADPSIFYPPAGTGTAEPARVCCDGCPVRQTCGDYALQTGERHGVWGGLTARDRRAARKARREAAGTEAPGAA